MVKIWCPATCANLGSGFDVAGLAVESPFDIVSVEEASNDDYLFRWILRVRTVHELLLPGA